MSCPVPCSNVTGRPVSPLGESVARMHRGVNVTGRRVSISGEPVALMRERIDMTVVKLVLAPGNLGIRCTRSRHNAGIADSWARRVLDAGDAAHE